MKLLKLSVITLLFAAGLCAQQPQAIDPALAYPSFERNIFALGINADWSAVAAVNTMWYASPETARALVRSFGAQLITSPTSPQTGPALTRWKIVQVPDAMMPRLQQLIWRNGFIAERDLKPYVDLPVHNMQVLAFLGGCKINAGYIAGYYQRNPPVLFPGLAFRYAQRIIDGECGGGISVQSVLSAPVRGPVKLVKKIAGKKKYPSFWAAGREPKVPRPPKAAGRRER